MQKLSSVEKLHKFHLAPSRNRAVTGVPADSRVAAHTPDCDFGKSRCALLRGYLETGTMRKVAWPIADQSVCRDMSATGPSQHCAPPHDFGRKRGIAEVEWQPSIAEGDARDPVPTLAEAFRCGAQRPIVQRCARL